MTQSIRKEFTQGSPGHVLSAQYFYFESSPRDNSDLAIVCGGYEKCAPDFKIDRNNYPFYFIKYILGGKGTLFTPNRSLLLKPGMISAFPAGVPHRYIADPEDPLEHIFVTFIGHQAHEMMKLSNIDRQYALNINKINVISEALSSLLNEGLAKGDYAHEVCCCYLRLILYKLSSHLPHCNVEQKGAQETFRKCKKYIDLNFSNIQSPSQVAQACNVNVRYLSSLFKKFHTHSPHDYINRLRLNKAANLLLSNPLPINQIAHLVGYEDPYHFSRSFKQYHGISPKQYRRQHYNG